MHKVCTCKHFAIWNKYTHISKSILTLCPHAVSVFISILKAKSKFTLLTIEYIFTAFEFNQIKYCNELLVPALSLFTKNNLGKLMFFQVICAFIESPKSAFPNKIQSKPRI